MEREDCYYPQDTSLFCEGWGDREGGKTDVVGVVSGKKEDVKSVH